ncbi:murein biosynthesis integral membrane protein MurJ [Clostridium sp. 2218st1_F5_2218SCRN_220325]|uniref:murein biosynthesis integral membrane protein MurJ n=1 Tax=Clostridium sp. 2218st1_F5_2218SCRN_220325 TaxID=3143056 RepID=UPI00319E43FE
MSKVAKATISLILATTIAKILGFFRELVLASSYGASMYSDAYLTAINIPNVIFTVIGGTLATAIIPLYFEIKKDLNEKESLKYINNMLNIVLIICVLLTFLGVIFTEKIVKVFAIGFEGEILELSINFTRVIMGSLLFSGLSYIMTSYLQIKNRFTIPGLISIPRNIIIITSIIISVKYGVYIMIWGTLLGICAEFLFQLPFAIKEGYRYKLYINLKDKYIKRTCCLIGPILIGVAVNQVNSLIDRTLASTLVEGSISALNYANRLNGFVMALFITSIGAVIYPILSQLSAEENKEKFIKSVVKCINTIILLVIPISIGAIILSTPIVKLLFQRGEFDERATSMTAIALTMYSIGMVAFGLRDILGKVFYSLKDTKTPMINGVIAVCMNIILNIILVEYLHLAGLALATSISAIICILMLFKSLKKKIGYFGQDMILKTTVKSIISSLIMGIIINFVYNVLSKLMGSGLIIEMILLLITVVIGVIVYAIVIILFKVEEINEFIISINKKIKR